MIVKLLTEYHLEFLSLKGGCRGSSESTLVKMSKCRGSYYVPSRIIEICLIVLFCSDIKKNIQERSAS